MNKDKFRYWLDFNIALAFKEIKARYKYTVFGFLWMFLNPVLQMLVIGFVFRFFVPVRVDNYFLFLFSGLLIWNFFSISVTRATPMFVYERSLIQKAKFPREAIILSIIFSNLFHFVISIFLLLIFVFLTSSVSVKGLLLLPVIVVWLTILTSAFSLIFASLNVRFRDVNFLIQAIMPIWFYATPVMYTINLLPKNLYWLFHLNPMTSLVELMRYSILNIPLSNSTFLISGLFITILILIISMKYFKKENIYFDDWL